MTKKFAADGMRLTDCCGAASTISIDDGVLYCKACYNEVEWGEGDGSEYHDGIDVETFGQPITLNLDA